MGADLLVRLRERAAARPRKIVYPEGVDARVLRAARRVADAGIAKPILIGRRDEIEQSSKNVGIGLSEIEIVEHNSESAARYISILLPEWRSRGITETEAHTRLRNPMYFASAMVRAGDAD